LPALSQLSSGGALDPPGAALYRQPVCVSRRAGIGSKNYLTLIHKKVSTGLSDLLKERADFVAAVRENSLAWLSHARLGFDLNKTGSLVPYEKTVLVSICVHELSHLPRFDVLSGRPFPGRRDVGAAGLVRRLRA
jgi:hypothetical protein